MQILTKCKNAIKRNKAKFLIALTVMAMSVMTCMSCFAEGADVGTAVTGGLSIFTATVDTLFSNPILVALVGAGLIPIGFKIFKSAKKAAK